MPSTPQRPKRNMIVMPVRVHVGDTVHHAQTTEISGTGARLSGLRGEVQVGQVITLECDQQESQFRVVWTRRHDGDELHVGIQSLDPKKNIWGDSAPGPDPCPEPRHKTLLKSLFARG